MLDPECNLGGVEFNFEFLMAEKP